MNIWWGVQIPGKISPAAPPFLQLYSPQAPLPVGICDPNAFHRKSQIKEERATSHNFYVVCRCIHPCMLRPEESAGVISTSLPKTGFPTDKKLTLSSSWLDILHNCSTSLLVLLLTSLCLMYVLKSITGMQVQFRKNSPCRFLVFVESTGVATV